MGKRMESPKKVLVQTEGTLRRLIENLVDAQEGLQKIGEAVRDEPIKRFLLAESLARAEFRGELENILHQEGVRDIHETGTPAGKFLRAWSGLKLQVGASDDSLLEIAEKEEQRAIEAYHEALSRKLPRPIEEVLANQVQRVVASHKGIGKARESLRQAAR
jgi:uncharacterized protein (TIGR02284 family)